VLPACTFRLQFDVRFWPMIAAAHWAVRARALRCAVHHRPSPWAETEQLGAGWSAGVPLSMRSPDYADVAPLAQALISANPERVLWAQTGPTRIRPACPAVIQPILRRYSKLTTVNSSTNYRFGHRMRG
jgi:hypothetical protein